jgi:hypothetical protein
MFVLDEGAGEEQGGGPGVAGAAIYQGVQASGFSPVTTCVLAFVFICYCHSE